MAQQLREAEGRIYHKGRRQSSGQKTCVALLFRQPITMEPKQRVFWGSGGTQVRRPRPSHGPQLHGCLDTQKEQGEIEMGDFIKKGRQKRAKSSMKT